MEEVFIVFGSTAMSCLVDTRSCASAQEMNAHLFIYCVNEMTTLKTWRHIMLEYKELLKRGMLKVPKRIESKTRFEIPEAQVLREGSKTIINNFYVLASTLRRDPQHLLKFLLKELATSCESDKQRITFIGNFSPDLINKKIKIYVKNYVLCPECEKPDTKIIKQDRIVFLKCEACGAKHPVGKI